MFPENISTLKNCVVLMLPFPFLKRIKTVAAQYVMYFLQPEKNEWIQLIHKTFRLFPKSFESPRVFLIKL